MIVVSECLGSPIFFLDNFLQSHNARRFVSREGMSVVCDGEIDEASGRYTKRTYVIRHLRCQDKDKMVPVAGKISIRIGSHTWFLLPAFSVGDYVRFKAAVRSPRDYRNFNRAAFETYYKSKEISATGFVIDRKWIVKTGESRNMVFVLTSFWKEKTLEALASGIENREVFGIVRAIVFGEKTGIDKETLDGFKVLGLVHLIVVSGLHVVVFSIFVWWLVVIAGLLVSRFVGQRDLRFIATCISLILIWFYIAMAGFEAPAVRAGLISTVYLFSILLKRISSQWDVLAFSALVLIVINPFIVFNVSFQLTYAAVIGILVFSRFFVRGKAEEKLVVKIFATTLNMFIVSLGASLGVFPILVYHFEALPLFGPVASTILSPIIAFFVIPFAIFAAIISPLSGWLSSGIFRLLDIPTGFFLLSSDFLASKFRWSLCELRMDIFGVAAFYLLVITVVYWRKVRYKKVAVFLTASILGLGIFMDHPFDSFKGNLTITFLDVGQGSAVVVSLPDGRVMLIDGGGTKGSTFDVGEAVIAPFLKRAGAKKVEKIIVTHPHPDHYKGVLYIAKNFSPSELMVGKYSDDKLNEGEFNEWKDFLNSITKIAIRPTLLTRASWKEGDVVVDVLSPPSKLSPSWNANDASAVIRVKYSGVSFLLAADIEDSAERYLTENFELDSTVLQVPHHGSDTSSSVKFLDKVSPKYAVMQVGAFNKYGFPMKEVVDRYRAQGVDLYRTDLNGAVSFVTNGEWIKIYTGKDN